MTDEIKIENRPYSLKEIFALAGVDLETLSITMLNMYLRNLERKGLTETAEVLKKNIFSPGRVSINKHERVER
jgi:hypothetical protein